MSVATEIERLLAESSKLAFESGIRCGVADERCRILDWAQAQNDHAVTKVVTAYLQRKYEATK